MADTPEARAAATAQVRADALAAAADRMSEASSGMYGRFAGGQPLLVGHHSYQGALRDRDRADRTTRRAIEAREKAERAQALANGARDEAQVAAIRAQQSRPWARSDFQPGDVVEVRIGRHTDRYAVARANAKTLTLRNRFTIDDPKRGYDRVLSRTRDGVTVTNPEDTP